jgi:hypothetical protein
MLGFQQYLTKAGIEYSQVIRIENGLLLHRDKLTPLDIRVGSNGPQGQLLVSATFPQGTVDDFASEAETVYLAFEELAPSQYRQVLGKDATIRVLYAAGGVHAFQVIWETLLGQQNDLLQKLGKPVLGGGLRFVMPPTRDEADPVIIELKIESFLQDSFKLFLETQVAWPKPMEVGAEIAPKALLKYVDDYITKTVESFLGAK